MAFIDTSTLADSSSELDVLYDLGLAPVGEPVDTEAGIAARIAGTLAIHSAESDHAVRQSTATRAYGAAAVAASQS